MLAHSDVAIEEERIDKNNTIIALLILSDPIREEAPKTLDYFLSQGVDVKIISGDDPRTVHEIAHKAHLKTMINILMYLPCRMRRYLMR